MTQPSTSHPLDPALRPPVVVARRRPTMNRRGILVQTSEWASFGSRAESTVKSTRAPFGYTAESAATCRRRSQQPPCL
ncbi:hypothetical protein BDA96_08G060700 [Sorghum bicolor]|uniref:Uncharacterized protein n=2 Tax=Sorghum bicolor TaxID=4558 RepID=A0A921QG95_SORBI|nr:hypothetical protein BDA96_08G060700 [Sorghum bicolor]KAG0520283.1 hypothetical protein BDA96_08G060700 [Sorghum bicolor]KXG23101.1 hypothetical protein SORBI_3008G056700 [Sorghum bicolor]KXG23102.1 hypothetical protein SORBI_3008G056700 [Sorghum bicolor]